MQQTVRSFLMPWAALASVWAVYGADLNPPREAPITNIATGATARHDVLLIMVDQWNPRYVSWEPGAQVRTPNLQQLARGGLIFDNCYTPGPLCVPARVSLVTGRYPHNHHVFGNPNNYYVPAADALMFRDTKRPV